MSETPTQPLEDQRIYDEELAWDMAHAAKPYWEAARAANQAAEKAQSEVLENHNGLDRSNDNIASTQTSPESNIETDQLRAWIHNYKFYALGTLDNTNTPDEKIIETFNGRSPMGYKSLGTMPKRVRDILEHSQTTHSAIGNQSETSKFDKKFNDLGITEKLTIKPVGQDPERNKYKELDPSSDKADERIVSIVYERNGTRDGMGRLSNLGFTLCLPQSEADVFARAVADNPSLIREMVDIAMLEELEMGEGWNGVRGTGNTPRGDRLAIRTDFTQGPEDSLIVPFAEAA